ncbi:hypothetical protein SAMN05444162_0093 [Paenibacillaceae bacterium GAS479]|nr:hypothetical protein SAMN05444162_0093 [Paenibacillaceae bacterium GAS479]
MYTVTIPRYFNEKTTAVFYDEIYNQLQIKAPDKIKFDFNGLEFIDPFGVVTLWNMVDLFERHFGADIYYSFPDNYRMSPRKYPAIDYLDDCLFFEKVMGKKLHPGSSERSTTNGLEKLRPGSFNLQYIEKTTSWLKGNVHLRSKSFSFLDTTFAELFNNINDHSDSTIGGCCFAQHYPSMNEIVLCVGDAGRGIAEKMKEKFTHNLKGEALTSDYMYIDFATEHKVSTKSKPGNRGLGLENLLAIIKNNKGSIKIISNAGEVKYTYKKNPEGEKRLRVSKGYYNGTIVLLKLRTDTLDFEEEEEFEWTSY